MKLRSGERPSVKLRVALKVRLRAAAVRPDWKPITLPASAARSGCDPTTAPAVPDRPPMWDAPTIAPLVEAVADPIPPAIGRTTQAAGGRYLRPPRPPEPPHSPSAQEMYKTWRGHK